MTLSNANDDSESAPRPEESPVDLSGRSFTIVGINYAPELTGIGPYTTFMAETLVNAGARVKVVTGVPHYPNWSVARAYQRGLRWVERVNGVEVVRLRHHVPKTADLRGRALMESTFTAAATQEVLRSRSEAIIAVTPSLAGLAAAVAGRRGRRLGVVVQDLTGEGASQSGTTSGGVGSRIASAEYRMLRSADLIGVIAQGFTEVLVGAGVEPGRIVHTPNFSRIARNEMSIEEARDNLGWEQGRLTVVHTGNMGMKQGLEVVADAARLRPDIRWVLVGHGNQRAHLERLAADLDNMEIHDPYSDELYPMVLAAADVLLLSERAGVGNMSLPSKLTAYVAAGRPIVAAVDPDGLSAAELATAQIALPVPSGRADEVAASVDRLVGAGSLARSLADAQRCAHSSLHPLHTARGWRCFASALLPHGGVL